MAAKKLVRQVYEAYLWCIIEDDKKEIKPEDIPGSQRLSECFLE